MGNLTVCDKFKPIILESQLCYSIDVADIAKNKTTFSHGDNRDGLLLLLDPNPYPVTPSDNRANRNKDKLFKVYIHTLAQHTAYGPGAYGMHALKRMTGTESFLQLPDGQKKCRVHNREKCQTGEFLDQVKLNCRCVPWPLVTERAKEEVKFFHTHQILVLIRDESSVDQRVSRVSKSKR